MGQRRPATPTTAGRVVAGGAHPPEAVQARGARTRSASPAARARQDGHADGVGAPPAAATCPLGWRAAARRRPRTDAMTRWRAGERTPSWATPRALSAPEAPPPARRLAGA